MHPPACKDSQLAAAHWRGRRGGSRWVQACSKKCQRCFSSPWQKAGANTTYSNLQEAARTPDVREHRLGDDGLFTHNRRGSELCKLYQSGECVETDRRGFCARNPQRRHQCAKCLNESHGANRCPLESPRAPRPNHGVKGRGKKGNRWDQQSVHVNSDNEASMTANAGDNGWKHASVDTGTEASAGDDNTAECGSCTQEFKGCILHLFSGPHNRHDGFAAFLRKHGWQCDEYDIVNGDHENLASDHVWKQGSRQDQAPILWCHVSRTTLQYLYQCQEVWWCRTQTPPLGWGPLQIWLGWPQPGTARTS